VTVVGLRTSAVPGDDGDDAEVELWLEIPRLPEGEAAAVPLGETEPAED
jgi:hypothetical protein